MQKLSNCLNLEILNLNNNAIKDIENLEKCSKIKKLLLFKNKIQKI